MGGALNENYSWHFRAFLNVIIKKKKRESKDRVAVKFVQLTKYERCVLCENSEKYRTADGLTGGWMFSLQRYKYKIKN